MKTLYQVIFIFTISIASIHAQQFIESNEFVGHTYDTPHPCIHSLQRRQIQIQLRQNIEQLKKEGKLNGSTTREVVRLGWPLAQVPGHNDFGYHTVSAFVDHKTDFPNRLEDYNCGERSFDTDEGYNHAGTDFSLWPYEWNKMEEDQIEVVAAAAGIIIGKDDGNFDQNCEFVDTAQWNAVYVRHADGTQAWYGHLKENSLLEKEIGDPIDRGEYIGVVGSSGTSTGPHLHFELQDEMGNIIDPYVGDCNQIDSSYWLAQRPYFDSAINRLSTHDAFPEAFDCPELTVLNEELNFCGGDIVILIAFLRDQQENQLLEHSIIKPDGSTFLFWSNALTGVAYFPASFTSQSVILPTDPQKGTWKYKVKFNDENYVHDFYVCADTPIIEIPSSDIIQSIFPNPAFEKINVPMIVQDAGSYHMQIFNVAGQLVYKQKLILEEGKQMLHFSIQDLAKGIYLFQMTDINGQGFQAAKFVKN